MIVSGYDREADLLDWYYTDDGRNEPSEEDTTMKLVANKDNFDHVFVYGTLRRGEPNHHLMGEAYCAGRGVTELPFLVYGRGFPLARLPVEGEDTTHAGPLVGEVYAVDKATLARLDELEGHPTFYKRTYTAIIQFPRKEIWMYHWNSPGVIRNEVVKPFPFTEQIDWCVAKAPLVRSRVG